MLGVDPGKTTGWASYDTQALAIAGAAQAPGNEFLDLVIPWVDACKGRDDVRIVAERFVITGGTVEMGRTEENWSIEQIGLLRHHARWAGLPFELQGAGDVKKFAPNERLRAIGWYVRGREHANDALRHVLLNVARHHPEVLDQILSGVT